MSLSTIEMWLFLQWVNIKNADLIYIKFCELIKNILFYNYSLGSEQWAPSCNYTHLLIFILSPETCWQISVVCYSRTSLWCRKRDVLLKLHLYTDRTGSFTGSAHLRSKWSVCGPQWEMSLTFLMYDKQNCCSSCQILGPFPTFLNLWPPHDHPPVYNNDDIATARNVNA